MSSLLSWLAPFLQEHQVPADPEAVPWVLASLQRLAGCGPQASDEEVWRVLQARWLSHGPPGRLLLGSLLRGEVFSRRDSPLRPKEGSGYYKGEEETP